MKVKADPYSETLHHEHAPPAYQPPSDLADRLDMFIKAHSISAKYKENISRLGHFRVVYILDDSSSMCAVADQDDIVPKRSTQYYRYRMTRWEELKISVKVIMDAHNAACLATDVYFLNRASAFGVTDYSDLLSRGSFATGPMGSTQMIPKLEEVFNDYRNSGDQRPLIVHIFTDGEPNEGFQGLGQWLRTRPMIDQTFISLVLCSDDEGLESQYRPMEYLVPGRMGWMGAESGIKNVDVSEDYRGEKRDVRRARTSNLPLVIAGFRRPFIRFSFGDYIVKVLLGIVDPAIHMIDIPQGGSVYASAKYRRGVGYQYGRY
ncbi:hypothetical protein HDU84_004711 [Entophlyctis sp. JEL0112]|nr:hypothetical protein HDU84_004711 [Entophlyctis sp. JEL0112]